MAFVIHVPKRQYKRIRGLLREAKGRKVWEKHWGKTSFTVEVPGMESS